MVYFNSKGGDEYDTIYPSYSSRSLPRASISFIRRDKNGLFTTCMSYEEVQDILVVLKDASHSQTIRCCCGRHTADCCSLHVAKRTCVCAMEVSLQWQYISRVKPDYMSVRDSSELQETKKEMNLEHAREIRDRTTRRLHEDNYSMRHLIKQSFCIPECQ